MPFPESDGGRILRRHVSQRLSHGRRQRAAVRAFNYQRYWPACANVPVRGMGLKSTGARVPGGDRVRARNDQPCDHAAHFISSEKPMTAYLISLALVGLIVIAVWESCS
ncbi:hypothetical protein [Bradyrhizobium lablabi]|uniref:hypothetical protein n=1 Tax=Bradyrhizobium lablabi TaxID=722472 RepID=UPI001561A425|nr:hypothetical protein [Bradyrhizobium lablabi]